MSRNSKNATRLQQAREISKSRQSGHVGATQTEPKHGKQYKNRAPQNKKGLDRLVGAR